MSDCAQGFIPGAAAGLFGEQDGEVLSEEEKMDITRQICGSISILEELLRFLRNIPEPNVCISNERETGSSWRSTPLDKKLYTLELPCMKRLAASIKNIEYLLKYSLETFKYASGSANPPPPLPGLRVYCMRDCGTNSRRIFLEVAGRKGYGYAEDVTDYLFNTSRSNNEHL